MDYWLERERGGITKGTREQGRAAYRTAFTDMDHN